MSFVKVMIHAVWGTGCRRPLLAGSTLQNMCEHIKENAKKKSIRIDRVNGHDDHLHCLSELHHELSVGKQIQLIKGESSHWINGTDLLNRHFEWAEDYYAVSVSESDLDRVRAYIDNQQEHHKKISFKEEYEQLLKEFKIEFRDRE